MNADSKEALTDLTEWSGGKRFIAPDADNIGHINDALREVLKFKAALRSSPSPLVSLLEMDRGQVIAEMGYKIGFRLR